MSLNRRLDHNRFRDDLFTLVDDSNSYEAKFQLSELSDNRIFTLPNEGGRLIVTPGTMNIITTGAVGTGVLTVTADEPASSDFIILSNLAGAGATVNARLRLGSGGILVLVADDGVIRLLPKAGMDVELNLSTDGTQGNFMLTFDGEGDLGEASGGRFNNAFIKNNITAGNNFFAAKNLAGASIGYSFTGAITTGMKYSDSIVSTLSFIRAGNQQLTMAPSGVTVHPDLLISVDSDITQIDGSGKVTTGTGGLVVGNTTILSTSATIDTTLVLSGGSITDTDGDLNLQIEGENDVIIGGNSGVGDNPRFEITGWDTGSGSQKTAFMQVLPSGLFNLDIIGETFRFATNSSRFEIMGNAGGSVRFFPFSGLSGRNAIIRQYGYLTSASGQKYVTWQLDDSTDMFTLDREDANVLGFKVKMPLEVGDGTNETQISSTGVLTFVGTAGLPHGNMDQNGGTFTVTLTNQDQLYELDADTTNISAGPLNDVTFDGDHYLKVNTAGVYKIDWSLICQINAITAGSEHLEFEVLKNGNATGKGESHLTHKNTVRDFPIASTTLLVLAVDDEISLGVIDRTSSGKIITVDHLEMSMFMVGGA